MKNFWRKFDWTANKIWLLALSVIMVITILGVGVAAVGDPVAMGSSYTAGKLPVIGADGISLEDGPDYNSGTNTVDASSTGLTIATDAGVGKILTSDGSGVGAWAAAPAGTVPNSGATEGVLLTGDGADGWNVSSDTYNTLIERIIEFNNCELVTEQLIHSSDERPYFAIGTDDSHWMTFGKSIYKRYGMYGEWDLINTLAVDLGVMFINSTGYIFIDDLDNNQLLRSIDNGANFSSVLVYPVVSYIGHANSIDENVNGDMFLGLYALAPVNAAMIYRSVDSGENWSQVYFDDRVNSGDNPNRHIHSVQCDPYTGYIYAAQGDGSDFAKQLRSDDDGATWDVLSSGSPAYTAIEFTPTHRIWGEDTTGYSTIRITSDDVGDPRGSVVYTPSATGYWVGSVTDSRGYIYTVMNPSGASAGTDMVVSIDGGFSFNSLCSYAGGNGFTSIASTMDSNDVGYVHSRQNGDDDFSSFAFSFTSNVADLPGCPVADTRDVVTVADTTATILGRILSDGDDDSESQFKYGEVVKCDNFEWGSDGDDITTSGGGITWTASGTAPSYNQISTSEYLSGTRSVDLYAESTSAQIHTTLTASDTNEISLSIFLPASSREFRMYHGDASHYIQLYVVAGELKWYDGSSHDTGIYVPLNKFFDLTVTNLDFTAATYDIIIGDLVSSTATTCGMNAGNSYNGVLTVGSFATTGSIYIDDVVIQTGVVTGAWDDSSDNYYRSGDRYSSSLSGLSTATEYAFQTRSKNSYGEGKWSDKEYFTTTS